MKSTKKIFTKYRYWARHDIRQNYTQGWIYESSESNRFALVCLQGLQSLQSFSGSVTIRKTVMTCSPIRKSCMYSRWNSSVGKYAQEVLLLSLKQRIAIPFWKPLAMYSSFPFNFIIFCSLLLHLIKNSMKMFILSSRRKRWSHSPSAAKKGSLGIKQTALTCLSHNA